jgi:hypothetical protein
VQQSVHLRSLTRPNDRETAGERSYAQKRLLKIFFGAATNPLSMML